MMAKNAKLHDLNYSVRRYLVDDYLLKKIESFNTCNQVLDIGGKKKNKRGFFDIENYAFEVKYLNIDASTEPDYVGSAYQIPVEDETFDGFVMTEVLEHLEYPEKAIEEAFRILKKGGVGIITTPFMFHIHADPHDYNRPTKQWFINRLSALGFEIISLEYQGRFWAVILNEIRFYLRFKLQSHNSGWRKRGINLIHKSLIRIFYKYNLLDKLYKNNILDEHTTGFGILIRK